MEPFVVLLRDQFSIIATTKSRDAVVLKFTAPKDANKLFGSLVITQNSPTSVLQQRTSIIYVAFILPENQTENYADSGN